MAKNYHFILLFWLTSHVLGFSQDLEYLTVNDFDLKGRVKTCTVITDYGSEVFEFNKLGLLVRSTTQYNEQDQDITIYKYIGDWLVERRMESYKNGKLDATTSMANFFEIDTSGNKVINERVVSYDKQFFENQVFRFDDSNRLVGITVSHQDAVDETRVEYVNYKEETTKTYLLNGVIQKSIRTSSKKNAGGEVKTVLTKDFLDGQPTSAVEETYGANEKLLTKVVFSFDTSIDQFAIIEEFSNVYDEDGILSKTIIKRGNTVFEKEYIFQFDDNETKNWVKKIVTPDNTYTTRKIEYYTSGPNQPQSN
ncbi:MAG: hypothetical protein ED555_12425 [Allomuricauda sp.]|nr:MAG: hypothetical protein ED555_12425 [Allomuricauda sp.]